MAEVVSSQHEEEIDIIWGAPAIAKAIRRTTRQVNHMLQTNSLPGARKICGRWCVARASLRATFLNQEVV